MKIFLYSIHDVAAGFSQPFSAVNDAVARRMFANSVRAETPNIANTNSEDKTFYKLGELDSETGVITSDVVLLANAEEFMPSNEELEERELRRKAAYDSQIAELNKTIESKEKEIHRLLAELSAKSLTSEPKRRKLWNRSKKS